MDDGGVHPENSPGLDAARMKDDLRRTK